jgi:hypothetical protein
MSDRRLGFAARFLSFHCFAKWPFFVAGGCLCNESNESASLPGRVATVPRVALKCPAAIHPARAVAWHPLAQPSAGTRQLGDPSDDPPTLPRTPRCPARPPAGVRRRRRPGEGRLARCIDMFAENGAVHGESSKRTWRLLRREAERRIGGPALPGHKFRSCREQTRNQGPSFQGAGHRWGVMARSWQPSPLRHARAVERRGWCRGFQPG